MRNTNSFNIGNRLYFSKYSKVLKKDNSYALIHSLRMKPVFLDSELYATIKDIEKFECIERFVENFDNNNTKNIIKKTINELIKNKILVKSKDVDDKVINFFRDSISPPYIQIAYFILTERCNFNCNYCFIRRNKFHKTKEEEMSYQTAEKGLSFFSKQIKRIPSLFEQKKLITFYGGEPLLNYIVLQKLLVKIDKLKKTNELPENTRLSIVTNGSLITPDIAKSLRDYNVSVGVSVDGDEFSTNCNRKFINSDPAYSSIKKGIEICKRENVNLSLSVTLSEACLRNPQNVIHALINEHQVKSLGFNMLLTDKKYTVESDYFYKVSKFIIDAFQEFRKKNIYEDRILRKVKAFFESEVYPFDCGASGGRQIVIAPDGQIGICHGFLNDRKYFMTNVNDLKFDPQKSKTYIEWNKRTPLNMPECQDCVALGICGGGCPMNAYSNNHSIWALDERFCVHAKMTLEWLIWELYANIRKTNS